MTEKKLNCIDKKTLLTNAKFNIEKFGLQVIMVSSTAYSPSFAYSVGLAETYKHPEVIIFGLPNDFGHEIINDVAEIIKKEEVFEVGKIYKNIFKNGKAIFLKVDNRNIDDYFGVALQYYQENKFDAIQLVWTDRNDTFPWEENFEEEFNYIQPLLDRNADFKFSEPKDLTIFTTRQWVEENKPILRVVHDEEGDWQFLTGDQMEDDIRIIALEQLILNDNSLNQVFDLEYGEAAEREYVGGKWSRIKIEE